MKMEICIDVDDVARAVEFYGRGLGLEIPEHQAEWAKAMLGEQVFWIMKIPSGTAGPISRDYKRHWTPVHLDFQVDDIDAAVARAVKAGGKLDREIVRRPGNSLATLSDPAGNGIDLVERKKK
ncbi:MAG TPA: VOC family protein [Candidatus Binataceae bacterium]